MTTCTHGECTLPARAKTLCDVHYKRQRDGRNMDRPIRPRRETATEWGDWFAMKSGYVARDRWDGSRVERQLQHREVMSRMLGRPLLPHETPHHKDGNRSNNRPDNLELWSTHQPAGQRVEDKVAWAEEILALYKGLTYSSEV